MTWTWEAWKRIERIWKRGKRQKGAKGERMEERRDFPQGMGRLPLRQVGCLLGDGCNTYELSDHQNPSFSPTNITIFSDHLYKFYSNHFINYAILNHIHSFTHYLSIDIAFFEWLWALTKNFDWALGDFVKSEGLLLDWGDRCGMANEWGKRYMRGLEDEKDGKDWMNLPGWWEFFSSSFPSFPCLFHKVFIHPRVDLSSSPISWGVSFPFSPFQVSQKLP